MDVFVCAQNKTKLPATERQRTLQAEMMKMKRIRDKESAVLMGADGRLESYGISAICSTCRCSAQQSLCTHTAAKYGIVRQSLPANKGQICLRTEGGWRFRNYTEPRQLFIKATLGLSIFFACWCLTPFNPPPPSTPPSLLPRLPTTAVRLIGNSTLLRCSTPSHVLQYCVLPSYHNILHTALFTFQFYRLQYSKSLQVLFSLWSIVPAEEEVHTTACTSYCTSDPVKAFDTIRIGK